MAYGRYELVLQPLEPLSLGGIAQGPQQPAAFDLTLDEVVLSAFLQGLRGKSLVVHAGEHNQRNTWCRRPRAAYRSQPFDVRQPQVKENDVDRMLGEAFYRFGHRFRDNQFGQPSPVFPQHLAKQTGVTRIVFDDEKGFDQFRAHLPSSSRNNSTFVGKKPLPKWLTASAVKQTQAKSTPSEPSHSKPASPALSSTGRTFSIVFMRSLALCPL